MDPKPLPRAWFCVCIIAAGIGVFAGRQGALRAEREALAAAPESPVTPATQPPTPEASDPADHVYAIPSIPRRTERTTEDRLAKRIPIHFEGNKLINVVDHFRQTTGLNVFVNWPQLDAAGVAADLPVILKLDATPAETLLALLLQQVSVKASEPIDFEVMNDIVVISTRSDLDAMRAKPKAPTTQPATNASVRDALKKRVSIDFTDARFDRVIESLRDATGQNFVIDWRALRWVRVFDDTPVTLTLTDVPADQALKLALRQVTRFPSDPVEYRVVDGVVKVSTGRLFNSR